MLQQVFTYNMFKCLAEYCCQADWSIIFSEVTIAFFYVFKSITYEKNVHPQIEFDFVEKHILTVKVVFVEHHTHFNVYVSQPSQIQFKDEDRAVYIRFRWVTTTCLPSGPVWHVFQVKSCWGMFKARLSNITGNIERTFHDIRHKQITLAILYPALFIHVEAQLEINKERKRSVFHFLLYKPRIDIRQPACKKQGTCFSPVTHT